MLHPLAYWTHNLSPFLFRFGDNIGLRWYGLAYLLGFAAGYWLLRRYALAGRSLLPAPLVMDFMTALVIGVMVGGRLGYFLFYQPSALLHDPLALLRVWEGGMASHGGFIGVIVASIWFARKHRIPFL
ncbi:MAG: prolipoprotein diacylglyceryl transferase, partial [Opitutaceae bacterium]|nr:prolipoprotein diacylglyceryl transferase [Opitutaceae bacterium]